MGRVRPCSVQRASGQPDLRALRLSPALYAQVVVGQQRVQVRRVHVVRRRHDRRVLRAGGGRRGRRGKRQRESRSCWPGALSGPERCALAHAAARAHSSTSCPRRSLRPSTRAAGATHHDGAPRVGVLRVLDVAQPARRPPVVGGDRRGYVVHSRADEHVLDGAHGSSVNRRRRRPQGRLPARAQGRQPAAARPPGNRPRLHLRAALCTRSSSGRVADKRSQAGQT
jgi:hypothetical protein